MDYDAQGRIVESRTIGPDGKLQVKINYDYSTAHEVVTKTINTSYWPDGTSIQKVAQNTFDVSSNFLSEIIEDFNQSGKHVSGHELFHDPMTGIFRCFDWKVAQQKYVAIDCPASEESHAGPKEVRKITREEVLQHLAEARQAALAEQKSLRMKPKSPTTQEPSATVNKEVALILPARLRPGQKVSGRVVEDPDRFAGQPDLIVARVTLPMTSSGEPSRLSGWTIEWKPSEPEPADGAVSFVVPAKGGLKQFTIRQAGNPSISVSGAVPVSKAAGRSPSSSTGYESSPLCFKRDLCVVAGKFSGDSLNTFVSFDSFPAQIVAETDSAAYVDVPAYMNAGPATLIVAEGKKVEAIMMVVAELALAPNNEPIETGKDTVATVHVNTVQELSDDQWRYGIFPPSSVDRARALVPDFNPVQTVKRDRELREKQEKKDGMAKKDDKKEEAAGMVLVVVSNATPDIASMRDAKQQTFVLHLVPESFAMGDFKYAISVDGLKTGTYALKATAIPFLAPVKAQEFEAETPAAENSSH